MEAAQKRGYCKVFEYESRVFDFESELNYELPEGYHFVEPEDTDVIKLSKLCWYGFDHGEKQEFTDWDKYDDSNDWTPAKSHKDCVAEFMAPSLIPLMNTMLLLLMRAANMCALRECGGSRKIN